MTEVQISNALSREPCASDAIPRDDRRSDEPPQSLPSDSQSLEPQMMSTEINSASFLLEEAGGTNLSKS